MITEEDLIERICILEAIAETVESVLCVTSSLGLTVEDGTDGYNYLPSAHRLCHEYRKNYETLETESKRNRRLKEVKFK